MAAVCINSRCKDILRFLIESNSFVKTQDIAKKVSVSKRSVYYDICKINEWLSANNISELEIVRGKGILITSEDKKRIESIVENETAEEDHIFSPTERVKLIICYAIAYGEAVYIEQLSDFCKVSRNTIFSDLRLVVKHLQEYHAQLIYESKKGYRITGDVVRIRALFFLYFGELLPLINSGVISFFGQEKTQLYYEKLKKIEKELETEYVDGILLSLSALLPIMYHNRDELYFTSLRKEEICNTKEYALVQEYFSDLKEKEKIYLSLHLLGSRMSVVPEKMIKNDAAQTVYEICKGLVSEFEKIACVTFREREELERALFVHISTSMYRYQYGIQLGNPLKDDVVREYPSIFELTKLVSNYLSDMVGIPVSDNEVAYLALHFGAYLTKAEDHHGQLRILIVCVNGISTGNMLKKEIQRLLPYAAIVDVVAAIDVHNVQEICDLVISTVQIHSTVPCITVNPILTETNKKTILGHFLIRGRYRDNVAESLFDTIKKYVREEDYGELKKDLNFFFMDVLSQENLQEMEKPGMLFFLGKNRVQVVDGMFDWEEAIRLSGEMLLEEHSIQKKYLEKIISCEGEYGSYMMIAPGVFLAHAGPEDGVGKLDFSFSLFPKGVCFPDGMTANVILMLAASDQESHLKILQEIMKVFSEEASRKTIMKYRNPEDIIIFLEKLLNDNEQ